MRNVEYITNGFGGPGPTPSTPNYGIQIAPLDPRFIQAPPLNPLDFGYLFSPSGGGIGAGGGRVYNLNEQFEGAASRLSSVGLNPRFIDIVRGPSGRNYLLQAIKFIKAYRDAVYSTVKSDNTVREAYNTAAMRIGTSSPLTPSRKLIENLTKMLGIDGVEQLLSFYTRVFSAL